MHEELRRRLAYEALRRKQRGDSERSISRALGIHRSTVRGLLKELTARREQGESALEREMPPPPARRGSKLDAFAERIDSWLGTYEDLTAVRLYEKLKAEGFAGGYTIVREYLKRLRGRRTPQQAFQVVETPAGLQAQFDWSPYTLPGCGQKAQLWGCSLSFSRARSFEAWDNTRQTTILGCLKRSFESFGGVPQQCVTDTMPGVVDRWECDQPLLNVRFVDFAAYYRFAVDIAPRGCPRYKGKKERSFWFVERNLLNGRTFASLEEFKEVLAWWIDEHAMRRPHPLTQRPLAEMLAEERPFLSPLPARPYDTREVVIRLVDTYGFVHHQTNSYRVPDEHIGELVYVCADLKRLEVFDRGIHRLAEHERPPDGAGSRQGETGSRPRRYDLTLLLERLAAWGDVAQRFGERLRHKKRFAGPELNHILGLQLTWSAEDIVEALAHAMSYEAYDARAVERILEARFKPRSLQAQIAETTRSRIREVMRQNPIQQRPLTDYTALRAGDTPTPHTGAAADDRDPEAPA
ncbi:MAG TPA: IS21 family transposase [Steroidobacteraceae bacterium]|nr:IS21 family transposase [Steroidobacteraceae bacterium]